MNNQTDKKRIFGTDGVRGVANKDLTCEMAFGLGAAAVKLLGPVLVIGRDTRQSGTMLEAALVAGISSRGGEALLAGIIPTPAVAFLTRNLDASGGVVISASHNPPEFNGIKFFDSGGYKITPAVEDQLEEGMQAAWQQSQGLPTGSAVGVTRHIEDAQERFIESAVAILKKEHVSLKKLKIAVDCGNGASCYTTPETLRRLGAEVIAINDSGDGAAINVDSGSANLSQLIETVKNCKADVGIAHDGDADRVIAVGAEGMEIDGDYIEAICALDRKATRGLPGNTIVSTVMCNIGLVQAMARAGIKVLQTAVGDANVLAAMRAGGYTIGGEQSGHTIFLDHNTTGDGLTTALMLLAAMQRSGKPLHELALETMQKYPQTLINVAVKNKERLSQNANISEASSAAEAFLQDNGGGRVLLRASGTEPLVRVMVEAAAKSTADSIAQSLAKTVEAELA